MNYRDIEWFALETNRDHSVVSEIASMYCISDSFVDYDGYSISSKGFLPTVLLLETQAGIKIAGRNIDNLRYADDTTLMAEK